MCALPLWIFKPFSDLKDFPHSSHLKASSSGKGSVFLFRNSSFLLWFLLNLEGLGLFFFVTAPSAVVFLVSREKENEEAMEREMLNACPMLVSAWQKSRHLVTRAGSSPLTAADIMFTGQGHIGEVLGVVKITEMLPVILRVGIELKKKNSPK